MKISKNTVCQLFEIRMPVWNGGARVVGLNSQRLGEHNEVRITALSKRDNQPYYPNPFYISGEKAREYPTKPIGNGEAILHMVPINDMELLERSTK